MTDEAAIPKKKRAEKLPKATSNPTATKPSLPVLRATAAFLAGENRDGVIGGFALVKAQIFPFKNVGRLDFVDDDDLMVVVWVTPAGKTNSGARTEHLEFTLQLPAKKTGAKANNKAGELMAVLVRRLRTMTWENLERGIIESSDAPRVANFSRLTDLNRFFDRWGEPNQAAQFFFYDAVWRYYFVCYSYRHRGSVNVLDPSVYITHGDFECPRNFLFDIPGLDKYFRFPWNMESTDRNLRPEMHSAFFSTDLDDMDIIEGGRHKLSALLDRVAENPDYKIAFISVTCLSLIIGDDVAAAVREFRKKRDIPIIFIDALKMSIHEHLAEILRFDVDSPSSPRKPTNLINLVGFPSNKGLEELKSSLVESGLKINACLLPDISLKEIADYTKASLQIFFPGKAFEELTGNTFRRLPLKSISPEAPCGIRRTWEFLESAAREGGVLDSFSAFKEKRAAEIEERWAAVVEASRPYKLGIVLQSSQISLLHDNTLTWGIPMVPILEEMGFRLHILIQSQPGSMDEAESLKTLFVDPAQHEFTVFSTADELMALLRDGDFQAVYSDVHLDSRLSRNGKLGFSIDFFELGFEGAFRAAARLQALCATPFYRRYAEYLSAAPGEP